MTDEHLKKKWEKERFGRLAGGVRIFCLIAVVIFTVFWVLDCIVYPMEIAWKFLFLRLLCSAGYALPLLLLRHARKLWHLSILGAFAVWWVCGIIGVMLTYTGYEASLYYAGLLLAIGCMAIVFPWTWRETVLTGVGLVLGYLAVALLNPEPVLQTAINNTAFILGFIGICVVANIQSVRLARAEFLGRSQLQEANDRLKELDRLKSEFFANVGHELRTPLTLIKAPLEVLLANPQFTAVPRFHNLLRSMARNTERLHRLINNLLDLSKLEAGKVFLRYGELEIFDFCAAIVPPFQTLGEKRQVEVCLEGGPVTLVSVDAEKLDIVIQNLMSNALKFTEPGGRVTLRVWEDDVWVWVEVRDSGIGIAAEHLGIIFDRFAQADGRATRRFEGTGIGLALVKELVELHGGGISVESEVGEGSTFRIRFPRGTAHIREDIRDRRQADVPSPHERREIDRDPLSLFAEAATVVPEVATETSGQGAVHGTDSVLVVEDNADLREFLKSLLEPNYQVFTASDGQEGVELALEILPDIVISDVMMPRLSGNDLTRTLKADPRTRHVPIILVTAKRGVGSTVEGLACGADDYVDKPFSTEELLARVRAQLRLRRLSEQLVMSEKMVMLGTLTAGLAHEVRNPANAIFNSVPSLRELAAVDGELDEVVGELLDIVEEGAKRIERLVTELLVFSQVDHSSVGPWRVGEGVQTTLRLLKHRLDGVQVTQDLSQEHEIVGRPALLNQIVMNLLDNALHALDGAGCIQVSSRREGDGIEIVVKDDGVGMPPEVLRRIFDPFFTTRAVGEGSGLGLHFTRQVVEEHKGRIDASSTPGEGTRIQVWLPVLYQK